MRSSTKAARPGGHVDDGDAAGRIALAEPWTRLEEKSERPSSLLFRQAEQNLVEPYTVKAKP
jgi:hypothetical protein